jgi:hypothetical protein
VTTGEVENGRGTHSRKGAREGRTQEKKRMELFLFLLFSFSENNMKLKDVSRRG